MRLRHQPSRRAIGAFGTVAIALAVGSGLSIACSSGAEPNPGGGAGQTGNIPNDGGPAADSTATDGSPTDATATPESGPELPDAGGDAGDSGDAAVTDPSSDAPCRVSPVAEPLDSSILFVALDGDDDIADGSEELPYGTLAAAVQAAGPGDSVVVRAGTYALSAQEHLVANGTEEQPISIRAAQGEQVVFDGTNAELGDYDGLIRISGSHAVFDGFEVRNANGGGVQLTQADHITVRNCRIHGIGFQALGGSGNDIVLQGNEVYNSVLSNADSAVDLANGGFGWSPAVLSFWFDENTPSQRWVVENNHIHDNWGECLDALHLDNSIFRGNVLHDCYSVNLYVDDAHSMLLEGNYIYNTGDTYQRPNGQRAHGIMMSSESAAVDAPVSDILIANNLIVSTTVGILYADFGGQGYTGIEIHHNVIADSANEAMYFSETGLTGGVARNNVFFAGGSGSTVLMNNGNWTFDHNAWPDGGAVGDANILEDPLFVAPGVGGSDPAGFRLSAGSPALHAGAAIASVTRDFACDDRDPVSPSIGIFEHAP